MSSKCDHDFEVKVKNKRLVSQCQKCHIVRCPCGDRRVCPGEKYLEKFKEPEIPEWSYTDWKG